jgi:hypothetical protein
MKPKSRTAPKPLQTGQVWKMENANLHIEVVGKRLVHYRLFKGDAKRAPTSLSGIDAVEKYLVKNRAVLVAG